MLPELIFMKGYRKPVCFHHRTTNKLQNNFHRSSVRVKIKKKKVKKSYDEKEEICFLDLRTSRVSEKSPLLKRYPQPSAKLPKIL